MNRAHHCDPRSDYICPACAQRQYDEERELERCDESPECPAHLHVHGCWHNPLDEVLVVSSRPNQQEKKP